MFRLRRLVFSNIYRGAYLLSTLGQILGFGTFSCEIELSYYVPRYTAA